MNIGHANRAGTGIFRGGLDEHANRHAADRPDRLRLHQQLSPAGAGIGSPRHRHRRLQPDRRASRSDGGESQRARTRPVPAVRFARSDVDFRRYRRRLDRGAEFRAARHHARDSSAGESRLDETHRRRLRKAARAHARRSARDAAARRRRKAPPRLSGKPGVLERGAARQRYRLAARSADFRPALSRPRRRRAQRTAHAVVLARSAAGRRCSVRHDLSQRRGRTLSAQQAWRAARRSETRQRQRHDRQSEMDPAGICGALENHDGARDRLCAAAGGRFRAWRAHFSRRRRPRRPGRGDQFLGLCRCRLAHRDRTSWSRIFDGVLLAQHRA